MFVTMLINLETLYPGISVENSALKQWLMILVDTL